MSANVKLMTNLEKHERDGQEVVDPGVFVTLPAPSVTYCRNLAIEAADVLHRVRSDLGGKAALCRVFFMFDAETFQGVFVEQARAAFLERWEQLSAAAART